MFWLLVLSLVTLTNGSQTREIVHFHELSRDFDIHAHHYSLLILQLSVVSRLKHDNFVELIGYCLEADNRILVYQHASLGSLHDVLHGRPIII